ncbi:MAG: hypothetical protein JO297_15500 [Nitrososphaeraceae archaeon]|nr:hypothetical protein [Nitrososphaeraceae archaeon]
MAIASSAARTNHYHSKNRSHIFYTIHFAVTAVTAVTTAVVDDDIKLLIY